jgi:two-component system, OmpR family, response regulator
MTLRVLIIEDEVRSAQEIADWLGESGWAVETACDGVQGLQRAREGAFDALVVDRMLPGLDGLSLTARLRDEGVDTPILFVTAMSTVDDRIAGLDGGGDDYLVKPFALAELKARVHALARRSSRPAETTLLHAGVLSLDRLKRIALREGQAIDLLPLEFKLIETLAMNAGRVVTRAMLLEKVWGFHFDPRTNIVETHISRLRRKIDRPGEPSLISHVRGAGYVLAG